MSKPLMSEILKGTEEALKLADSQDVSKLHDFLFAEPGKPMLFVGNGGMQGHYASMLYEQYVGIGKSTTPFMLRSMSDEVLRSCRCLLMSDGGNNIDIKDATKRMAAVNPQNTGGFTSVDSEKNILLKLLDKDKVFLFKHPHDGSFQEGFISVTKQFYRDALFYKAFTGKSASEQLKVDLDPTHCYQYELNNSDEPLTPLSSIQHFLVLHGGYGEPAAHYLEIGASRERHGLSPGDRLPQLLPWQVYLHKQPYAAPKEEPQPFGKRCSRDSFGQPRRRKDCHQHPQNRT